MGGALRAAVGLAHAAGFFPAWRRFAAAAADPGGAQRRGLRDFLRANADTVYGRLHGYARVDSARRFQDVVPIVDYDALAPFVERIEKGEPRVLTAEPVLIFERSGGSTRRGKMIPYTRSLLREFGAATGPWLWNLYTRRPRLFGRSCYWSISPVAQGARRTEGGTRIGFEDDTEYFGPLARWALARLLAVPSEVARIPDAGLWRRETARHLLARRDLGLLSVWSPTFLTLLMQAIEADLPRLAADLPPRRRREIAAAETRSDGLGEALWPRLALISCWTDGPSRAFLPELRRYFPRVEIQGKGLLATEGVVSFPLVGGAAPVAAVAGHFLEFLDLARPAARPRLVDELEPGGRYAPVVTTGGGFARYRLQDVVHCAGHYRRAPRLRFEGRLDQVADLCGEKVSPGQVEAALDLALAGAGVRPAFALVAPAIVPSPHYCLFVETDASDTVLFDVARALDAVLAEAHPYRYCRELGQLGPLRAVRIRRGRHRYERALLERGQRVGAIKAGLFDTRPIWNEVFEAAGAA